MNYLPGVGLKMQSSQSQVAGMTGVSHLRLASLPLSCTLW
jgi:hypothetical protein